jgi:hypothetical protein
MKSALFQISIFMAALCTVDAQTPKKPPVLDVGNMLRDSRANDGCPICSGKKSPVLEEGLPPVFATKLPDCDRVEVFLLAEDFKPGTAADRFPIRPDHGSSGIIGRKELKGAGAAKLCSLWRGLTFDQRVLTFSPPAFSYGLRFHRGDKVIFETSVSFTNHNFYYPRTVFPVIPEAYAWHGFRSGDQAGKELIAFLRETFPRNAAGE